MFVDVFIRLLRIANSRHALKVLESNGPKMKRTGMVRLGSNMSQRRVACIETSSQCVRKVAFIRLDVVACVTNPPPGCCDSGMSVTRPSHVVALIYVGLRSFPKRALVGYLELGCMRNASAWDEYPHRRMNVLCWYPIPYSIPPIISHTTRNARLWLRL